MSDTILTQVKDGLMTITLNNPSKHNCMGFDMLYALRDAIREAKDSDEVKAVLFVGAGEKSFSTGANIKEFNALNDKDVSRWIEDGNNIFNEVEQLSKPTAAYIQGYAMGGGLELALCCDFRLASTRAVLASPEMSNGWLPGWGGMTRLRRLIGEAKAKEVVLLAQHHDAASSERMGLLTQILDEGQEEAQLAEFMSQLTAKKTDIYALAKHALMDTNRTTAGTDLHFDVMAVFASKED